MYEGMRGREKQANAWFFSAFFARLLLPVRTTAFFFWGREVRPLWRDARRVLFSE
jgi:hypothetical protein